MPKKGNKKTSINSLSENIGSIILGFVVVLILGGFLLNIFKGKQTGKVGESGTTQEAQPQPEEQEMLPKGTYVVQKGDNLWKIAESHTGTGYNWVAIAKANNLTNPNKIEEGMKLVIPQEVQDEVTKESETLPETGVAGAATDNQKQNSEENQPQIYVVKKGDNLWKIAVTHYNNGYKWIEIARKNNLKNPDLIHTGNKLTLP